MANDLFDSLSNAHQRKILVALLDHNPQQAADLVNSQHAVSETDSDRIANHHVHLPKLEAYGYIEWDRSDDVITRGPDFERIRPTLELLDDNREKLPGDWV